MSDFVLTMDDLRVVARYAAECAEEALPIVETARPDDPRPREAIDAAWAFVHGAARSNRQRVAATGAHRAARETGTPAASAAAYAAGDAAASAYLHPLARATQVGHILRSAAFSAHAQELATGDESAAKRALDKARGRATPALVDVLLRYPAAPSGRTRVDQLLKSLDTSLRTQ